MSYYKNSFTGGNGSGGGYDSEDDIPFDSQSFTTARDVDDTESVIFDRADEGSTGLGSVIRVMNQLYDVVNRLKLEGHTEIKLPQIVVCGSQSSGKTSVLESISGEEFLPRGIDIQTRCPIVLQLINVKQKTKWVEFLHGKGKKYTNMNDVKIMIDKVNNKITSSGQIVSEDSITLKLFSPNVPNLTLVDLPGLVENPVEGHPADIVDKINKLVYKYISNENCVILAISAANTDIADSKSIKLARRVDPQGKRTLGVLTKLDLMDEGTNANDVLMGKKIKLELGIIGVVNRSYLEVQEGRSLNQQIRKEKGFLEDNYPHLAGTNGTPYLINKISRLLLKCIYKSLPSIKNIVEQKMEDLKALLDEIEEPDEPLEKTAILVRLLTRFVESYCAQVDGRRRNLDLSSLNASAKIKKRFDQYLGEEFEKLVAGTKLTDKDIDIAIQNSHGLHSRHIDYDDAFQELAKRELKALAPLVQTCTREVCKEMKNAVDSSFDPMTKNQYPKLFQKIKQVALELINERFKDCQRYLEDYLSAEASIARTIQGGFRDKSTRSRRRDDDQSNDDAYSTASNSSLWNGADGGETYAYADQQDKLAVPIRKDQGQIQRSRNQEADADLSFEDADIHRANVKRDVEMYFDGAKRQIMEHVSRGIVYKLVYGTSNKMSEYMLSRLHSAEQANELVVDRQEDEIQERRKAMMETLNQYEEANNVIDIILSNEGGSI